MVQAHPQWIALFFPKWHKSFEVMVTNTNWPNGRSYHRFSWRDHPLPRKCCFYESEVLGAFANHSKIFEEIINAIFEQIFEM